MAGSRWNAARNRRSLGPYRRRNDAPATRRYVKSAVKRAVRKNWVGFPINSGWSDTDGDISCDGGLVVPAGSFCHANAEFPILQNNEPGSAPAQEDVQLLAVRATLWARVQPPTFAEMGPQLLRVGSYLTRRDRTGAFTEHWDPSNTDDISEAPWMHWEQHLVWPEQWGQQEVQRYHAAWLDPANYDLCDLTRAGAPLASGVANIFTPCSIPSFTKEARPVRLPMSRFFRRGTRLKEDQALILVFAWQAVQSTNLDCTASTLADPACSIVLTGGGRMLVAHGS